MKLFLLFFVAVHSFGFTPLGGSVIDKKFKAEIVATCGSWDEDNLCEGFIFYERPADKGIQVKGRKISSNLISYVLIDDLISHADVRAFKIITLDTSGNEVVCHSDLVKWSEKLGKTLFNLIDETKSSAVRFGRKRYVQIWNLLYCLGKRGAYVQ